MVELKLLLVGKKMNVKEFLESNYSDLSNIIIIKTENAKQAAYTLFNAFYNNNYNTQKESVVFDCRLKKFNKINYSDYLFLYKKREFDGYAEALQSDYAGEKSFRFLLNDYILNFKPKRISESKNLFLHLTLQGNFVAIKKSGNDSIVCDLSETEQIIFNFLCFIEINKFWQYVSGVRDFNYKEKPLIIINFSEYLDEAFDYVDFLQKQNLNRKIIIISEINVPKKSH